jgi:hypothetical protein
MQMATYGFYIWFAEPLGKRQGGILQETKLFVTIYTQQNQFYVFPQNLATFCNKRLKYQA